MSATDAAYLAIIDDLEREISARVAAAEARVVEAEHRIDQWTRRVREQDRAMDVLLAARDWYQSEWEQATERIRTLEAAARALLTDADPARFLANDDAYDRWVRHRAALAALLEDA